MSEGLFPVYLGVLIYNYPTWLLPRTSFIDLLARTGVSNFTLPICAGLLMASLAAPFPTKPPLHDHKEAQFVAS